MNGDDDIEDICADFVISPDLVEKAWKVLESGVPIPFGLRFIPQTKREMALLMVVSLSTRKNYYN